MASAAVRPAEPGNGSRFGVPPRPNAMSANGPVGRAAGFHQTALLSDATATNAPAIPAARLPTVSSD